MCSSRGHDAQKFGQEIRLVGSSPPQRVLSRHTLFAMHWCTLNRPQCILIRWNYSKKNLVALQY